MAKKSNTFIIPFARKGSYLIGDSETEGRDQVISEDLRYNRHGLYDATNEARIERAREIAEQGHYTNIRIETVWEDAICISQGIIGHRERKRTTRPFNLYDRTPRTWTYEAKFA